MRRKTQQAIITLYPAVGRSLVEDKIKTHNLRNLGLLRSRPVSTRLPSCLDKALCSPSMCFLGCHCERSEAIFKPYKTL